VKEDLMAQGRNMREAVDNRRSWGLIVGERLTEEKLELELLRS